MISDPALCLLESKLGPEYEKIYHNRKQLPRCFDVKKLSETIDRLQIDLENERRVLVLELSTLSGESFSKLGSFNQNLVGITVGLEKAQTKSQNLASSCSQLGVDFTHITDKLDSATAVVSKAVMVQSFLQDIKIYDQQKDFELIKEELKKTNGLSFGDPGDEKLLDNLLKREEENYFYFNYLNSIKSTKGWITKNVNLHRTAEYVSKLIKILEITVKQKVAQTAYANIKKHQSILIMNLLGRFNDPSNKNDVNELKCISSSLFLLGVGEEAINNFIGSSNVFVSEEGIHFMFDNSILVEDTRRILLHYDTFCMFIANDCKVLWPRINEIFDRPQTVKIRYIKKICDVLSSFVSGVLNFYIHQRTDEYCTTLATMYNRTEEMINEICDIDKQEFITPQSFLDELFSPHQKEYGSIEISVYTAILNDKLYPTKQKLERALKPLTIFRKSEDAINPFEVFNQDLIPEFILISKSSISRCSVLSSPDQVSSNLHQLITIFLTKNFSPIMLLFVKVCANYISQNQDNVDNISEYLKIIMLLNSNVLYLEDVYLSSLKEILKPYSAVHTFFLKQKEEIIENLEKETVSGLQACINCAKAYSTKILNAQQKKSDFIQPEDGLAFITDACKEFCQFLKKLLNSIGDYIMGDNKVSFLTILGNELFDSITDHLLLYKYNISGALNLMMDTTEYQSVFGLMDIQEIDEKTSELVKISHLMTVTSTLVENFVQDVTLSKDGMVYAKKLLMLRSDAKEINIVEIFQT